MTTNVSAGNVSFVMAFGGSEPIGREVRRGAVE